MTTKYRTFGLTGGIAAGKSQVAQRLATYPIAIINLDEIGREITDRDAEVRNRIQALFTESILTKDGLNRARLSELVFADPLKRKALEALLHPLIWKEFNDRAAAEVAAGKKLVICEAALLVESGNYRQFEELIVVTAPPDVRKVRLLTRPLMNDALAEQILAAQLSEAERLRVATIVVENHGSREELDRRVDEIVHDWRERGIL